MTSKEKIWPQDYHSVTPYLIVKDAGRAIEFYKKAFNASEVMRMTMPDDKIVFAEIKIGDSLVQISEEFPAQGLRCPRTLGGSPVKLHLYVEDVDNLAKTAVAAGAKLITPVAEQFYGDRSGCLEDPFGHLWNIATRIEHISRKEMVKRFEAMMRQLPRA